MNDFFDDLDKLAKWDLYFEDTSCGPTSSRNLKKSNKSREKETQYMATKIARYRVAKMDEIQKEKLREEALKFRKTGFRLMLLVLSLCAVMFLAVGICALFDDQAEAIIYSVLSFGVGLIFLLFAIKVIVKRNKTKNLPVSHDEIISRETERVFKTFTSEMDLRREYNRIIKEEKQAFQKLIDELD